MAEMKGIATLIRPCATLARYEAALSSGEITTDTMVLIEDVRQIRWRGQIWNFVGKVDVNNVPYARADGLVLNDGTRFFLPTSAPGDDPEHTFAMLSDLQGGGVDVSTVVTKSELEEVEEVTATALIDLNTRKADVTFVEEAIATAVTNALNTAV